MCGRFTLKTPPDQWGQLLLPLIDVREVSRTWQPRYNVAPTQNVVAVTAEDQQGLVASYFRWGLIPSWAADLSVGNRMINARSETLHEKRSFSGALKRRRCLIIADGYYEWQKLDNGKQPFWIAPRSGGVMQLAGLWEQNVKATGEPIRSCTIITTAANDALSSVHDRMPALLTGASAERWADPTCAADEAQALLGPAENDFLTARKVSQLVNNPRNDRPECVEPI